MPQIMLLEGDTPRQSLNVLWGHMQFPESKDKAFEVYVRLELEQSGIWQKPNTDLVSLPASFIKALLNGHSAAELRHADELRGRSGVTAGLLLLNRWLASTKSRTASLNMAVEVLEEGIASRKLVPLPFAPYQNRPEMLVAWRRMGPVAHLWATYVTAHIPGTELAGMAPTERAARMLVKATVLQQWATTAHPRGKPVLDPELTWLLPVPAWMSGASLGELGETIDPAIRALLSPTRKR